VYCKANQDKKVVQAIAVVLKEEKYSKAIAAR
jgi:hypothetical protein